MEFDRIKEIVAEVFEYNVNTITRTTRLNEDLGLDSRNVIELMTALEEEFGVEIDEGTFIDTLMVGQLLKYVQK